MDEEQDSRFSTPRWAWIEVIQSEAILLWHEPDLAVAAIILTPAHREPATA
jgi:hypothetical protein